MRCRLAGSPDLRVFATLKEQLTYTTRQCSRSRHGLCVHIIGSKIATEVQQLWHCTAAGWQLQARCNALPHVGNLPRCNAHARISCESSQSGGRLSHLRLVCRHSQYGTGMTTALHADEMSVANIEWTLHRHVPVNKARCAGALGVQHQSAAHPGVSWLETGQS